MKFRVLPKYFEFVEQPLDFIEISPKTKMLTAEYYPQDHKSTLYS